MKDVELKLPTRNVLTGAVVNWEDDDIGFGDNPNNLTLSWKDLSVYRKKKTQTSIWRSPVYEEIRILHGGISIHFIIFILCFLLLCFWRPDGQSLHVRTTVGIDTCNCQIFLIILEP